MWNHERLNAYFADGQRFSSKDTSAKISLVTLGEINLPTGALVACDPYNTADTNSEPFEKDVAPGLYPMEAALASLTTPQGSSERVAAACIRFSSQPVVRWHLATLIGEKTDDLEDGEVLGYGVDSGIGAFMDEEVQLLASVHREAIDKALDQAFAKDAQKYALIPVADKNFAAFASGYGNGVYGTFWGYDEQGQIAALATDFDVLTGLKF